MSLIVITVRASERLHSSVDLALKSIVRLQLSSSNVVVAVVVVVVAHACVAHLRRRDHYRTRVCCLVVIRIAFDARRCELRARDGQSVAVAVEVVHWR